MKKRAIVPGVPLPPFSVVSNASSQPEDGSTPTTASLEVQPSDLVMIDPWLIDQNPYAPREIYTREMILERAQSLRERQNDPIHVIPHPERAERYMIADGWTRVLACREHKARETLLAKVHRGLTPLEAAWLGFQQNESRQMHRDYDRAMFFEKLIASGLTLQEVAERTGISRQTLGLYRAFAKLPEEVLVLVREHPDRFTYWAAYMLVRVIEGRGLRRAMALASRYLEENRSVRWLIDRANAELSPAPRKSESVVRQIRFANGYYRQRGRKIEFSFEIGEDDAILSEIETLVSRIGRHPQTQEKTTEITDVHE